MNRLNSHRLPRAARVILLCTVLVSVAACGPDPEQPGYQPDPDSSFVPPKPMGGGSDAGLVAGDPCTVWSGIADQRLMSELHDQLSQQYRPIDVRNDLGGNPNRYTTARGMMFTQVERYRSREGGMVVECIYTGTTTPAPATEDPDREQINCEHVMPRSRMADEDTQPTLYSHMESDIHNLLPSTPGANSSRGSLTYGNVTSDRNLDHMPSVIGRDANGTNVFEVRRERRGDIARTVFYFSVRWGIDIGPEEEATLRRWNQEDAPDGREQARNDAVQELQGNRNPFIDCPSLVDRIDDFRFFDIRDRENTLPQP